MDCIDDPFSWQKSHILAMNCGNIVSLFMDSGEVLHRENGSPVEFIVNNYTD